MSNPDAYPTGSIITLSDDECRARIQASTVGYVAFVNDEGQQMIPINFAWLDGAAYFQTVPDGVLADLTPGHDDVAFGIGHHDIFQIGWNVTVRGSTEEVRDPKTIDTVLSHDRLTPWAGGDRPLIIKLTPRSIDGRRVSVR